MKKLQNNFTTIAQSKRLMELGVPADSADCIWWSDDNFTSGLFDLSIIPYNKIFSNDRRLDKNGEVANLQKLPCWSVGRLMEIYCILRDVKCIFSLDTTDIIDNIIACFERNKLDFSKLDEYDTRN